MPDMTREELEKDLVRTHMQLLSRGDLKRTSCASELLSFATHLAPKMAIKDAYSEAMKIVAKGFRHE